MAFSAVLPVSKLIDNTMRCVEFNGRDVLIVRVAGEVLAVDDLCTHEDASLSSGVLAGDRVRCPLHGSWFCLRTGHPQEEPADEPLRRYSVRVENGWIELALPETPTES
jgi:3-phenylpropionate/trans-cinnamate dioxygenase ferredoxin subunit